MSAKGSSITSASPKTAAGQRLPSQHLSDQGRPDRRLAVVLSAVGEPNRLLLLRLLLDGERCVAQCVERTGLVQSLVSKHLRKLVDAGLVQSRRSGRRNYHSVTDPDGVRQVLEAAERLVHQPPIE